MPYQNRRPRPRANDNNMMVLLVSFVIVLLLGGGVFVAGFWLGGGRDDADDTASTEQSSANNAPTSEQASNQANDASVSDQNEATPDQDSDTTTADPDVDTEDNAAESAAESGEPIEIVRPELEEMRAFVPEGGTFMRYWWNNLNEDPYDEVLVAYQADGDARILSLGVKDDTVGYEVVWDESIPGRSVGSMTTARASDGKQLILAQSTQSGTDGFMNLYEYTADGPANVLFSGGDLDGQAAEVSYSQSAETASGSVYQASYADGEFVVDVVAPHDEANVESGSLPLERSIYRYEDGVLVFQETLLTTAAADNPDAAGDADDADAEQS